MTDKEIQQAMYLFSKMKYLSNCETLNHYDEQYYENSEILDELFQYLLLFFEPYNITFYPKGSGYTNIIAENIPKFLPQDYMEIRNYCAKNLYCMIHAYYKGNPGHPCKYIYMKDVRDHIKNMTLDECLNYMLYMNRRGIYDKDWETGVSKNIIQRIIELRKITKNDTSDL